MTIGRQQNTVKNFLNGTLVFIKKWHNKYDITIEKEVTNKIKIIDLISTIGYFECQVIIKNCINSKFFMFKHQPSIIKLGNP